MFEALIRTLIYLACLAAAYFLTVWVLQEIGLNLPYMFLRCIMVIFILIGVLVLYRLLWPIVGNFKVWPEKPTPPQG